MQLDQLLVELSIQFDEGDTQQCLKFESYL